MAMTSDGRVLFDPNDLPESVRQGSALSACKELAETAKTGEPVAKLTYFEHCVKRQR